MCAVGEFNFERIPQTTHMLGVYLMLVDSEVLVG